LKTEKVDTHGVWGEEAGGREEKCFVYTGVISTLALACETRREREHEEGKPGRRSERVTAVLCCALGFACLCFSFSAGVMGYL
jgi:hypothetical protein